MTTLARVNRPELEWIAKRLNVQSVDELRSKTEIAEAIITALHQIPDGAPGTWQTHAMGIRSRHRLGFESCKRHARDELLRDWVGRERGRTRR
jgi:hypothetical protein